MHHHAVAAVAATNPDPTDSSANQPLASLSKADLRAIPQFIMKTYQMVTSADMWISNDSFRINDVETLSRDHLPQYFNHANFSSFHRQLNMYNFERLDSSTFSHENFRKDNPKLLVNITRKKSSTVNWTDSSDEDAPRKKKTAKKSAASKNPNMASLLQDVAQIKRSQYSIKHDLGEIQTKNKELWDECHVARQAFQHQQDQIARLLGFLESVFKSRLVDGHLEAAPDAVVRVETVNVGGYQAEHAKLGSFHN